MSENPLSQFPEFALKILERMEGKGKQEYGDYPANDRQEIKYLVNV